MKRRPWNQPSSFGVLWARIAYDISHAARGGSELQKVHEYTASEEAARRSDHRMLKALGYLVCEEKTTWGTTILGAARKHGVRYVERSFPVYANEVRRGSSKRTRYGSARRGAL